MFAMPGPDRMRSHDTRPCSRARKASRSRSSALVAVLKVGVTALRRMDDVRATVP